MKREQKHPSCTGTMRIARERGTALLEFAIAVPFLLTLIFGVVDVERGLRQHFILQHAIQQVVYRGMSMPLLASGAVYSNGTAGCTGGYDPIHAQLQNQIQSLIVAQNNSLTNICVTTELVLGTDEDTLRLRARAPLTTLSPFMSGLMVSAEMDVPYLLD